MERDYFWKRIFTTIIGLTIVGLGIAGTIHSGLGVDPGSVLGTGVANFFNVSLGKGFAITNGTILIIALIVDKKWVDYGTFIGAIWTGYAADIFLNLIGQIWPNPTIIDSIIFSISGIFILALGVAIYTSSKLGTSSLDIPPEIISEKLKKEYGKVRIFIDGFYVLFGTGLGGNLGIGTLLGVIFIGPIIQVLRPGLQEVLNFSK